ncbi:MAG: hypothetical protein AAGC55_07225 [Myxococcota bacterium]
MTPGDGQVPRPLLQLQLQRSPTIIPLDGNDDRRDIYDYADPV